MIAAPFFAADGEAQGPWLDDFADDPSFCFEKVGRPPDAPIDAWHSRRRRAAGLANWLGYWRYAATAWRRPGAQGLITVFPQLALTAAVQKRLRRDRRPLLAWCFNIGAPPGRFARTVGRWAFRSVDHVVVHSTREVDLIRQWFGVPADRISFVPLQRGDIDDVPAQDTAHPFVAAMGSANRDYATLALAIQGTDIPLVVVAADRCLENVTLPKEARRLTGLSHVECLALAARARLNVVSLADSGVASGQVTIVEAMRMGRAVVATRTLGTVDYVDDGVTGLLVPPEDPAALRAAITSLWRDEAARRGIEARAADHAAAYFSDQAAGRKLAALLRQLSSPRRA